MKTMKTTKEKCGACNGSGVVRQKTAKGRSAVVGICSACQGHGTAAAAKEFDRTIRSRNLRGC